MHSCVTQALCLSEIYTLRSGVKTCFSNVCGGGASKKFHNTSGLQNFWTILPLNLRVRVVRESATDSIAQNCSPCLSHMSRAKLYTPPPSTPISGHKAFFRGGGGGVYFETTTRQDFYTPPPFLHPPTPRRVFSGVGGGGHV